MRPLMPAGRAPVLLYVLYPSHFKVMFRVARLLEESGRYAPIIYFDQHTPFDRDLEQAAAARITCIGSDGQSLRPQGRQPASSHTARAPRARVLEAAQRAVQRVPRWVRQPLGDAAALAAFVPKLGAEVAKLRREGERVREILRRHAVRLVIAPGDNVGYGTPVLFACAHELGIKALIVPFTVSNRLEMVADLRRYRHFSASRLENRALAARYPHWALEHDAKRVVRVPASRGFALEWAGLAPPDPWVLNSGSADAIAVESEFMRDYYARAGLPPDRFRQTGTLGDDAAARTLAEAPARRAALCSELGIPPERRIVLFSYGEYHYFFQLGRPNEFASQAELTEFWLAALGAMSGYNVVLSLHPSLDRSQVGHLEARGAKIASWPIEELIPLCDVYAVSISATARTAIACGKPVVDHDVFGFDYDNFVGLDAYWIAKTRDQFASTLARLASDEAFYQRAVAAQQAISPRFGTLDGRAASRLLALVDELGGSHGS